ncbi:MAG: PepSY domain-containing protein [Porticoccaceae bacterium]|nr:PepSY domain-containing protein [Porticoccaceae bacterium]
MVKPTAVLIHRYIGLVMTGFLMITGVTGALLAWYEPLDKLFAPANAALWIRGQFSHCCICWQIIRPTVASCNP